MEQAGQAFQLAGVLGGTSLAVFGTMGAVALMAAPFVIGAARMGHHAPSASLVPKMAEPTRTWVAPARMAWG